MGGWAKKDKTHRSQCKILSSKKIDLYRNVAAGVCIAFYESYFSTGLGIGNYEQFKWEPLGLG